MTKNILGVDLHPGDVLAEPMPDGTLVLHLIDHLTDYPGRWVGPDHARRAYDGLGWCATVGDREHFHILIGD